MILSRKYKEELNNIVMSEEMKKRILHNVLNENVEAKSIIPGVKNYNLLRRNMQIIAASFTVVVCLGVGKSYPQLLEHENNNLQQKEIAKGIDDENKVMPSSEESNAKDNKSNSKNDNDYGNNSDKIKTQDSPAVDENSGDGEISKISEPISNNENSPEIENKEVASVDSVDNSNEVPSINPKLHPNSNEVQSAIPKLPSDSKNEDKASISSDKTLKDTGKNQDETVKKKISDGNEAFNSTMAIEGDFIKEYKTLEEAENSVEFKINPVRVLPKGFNIDNISVISNQIIQIDYNNGKNIISFRSGKEIENISGDYNIYEFDNKLTVNNVIIDLKGNKSNNVNLAVWSKDNISYSISSADGNDKDMILNMIKSSF